MTPDYVRVQLRKAIRAAVAAGARHKRRPGLQSVQSAAADFAELMVLPAAESMAQAQAQRAMDEAVQRACARWEAALGNLPPEPCSPLWSVWVAGALCVIDHLAERINLAPPDLDGDPALSTEDARDLVRTQVGMLLAKAGVPQHLSLDAADADMVLRRAARDAGDAG